MMPRRRSPTATFADLDDILRSGEDVLEWQRPTTRECVGELANLPTRISLLAIVMTAERHSQHERSDREIPSQMILCRKARLLLL